MRIQKNATVALGLVVLSSLMSACAGSDVASYTKPEGNKTQSDLKPELPPEPQKPTLCAVDESTIPPYPYYRSIRSLFADPSGLLRIEDTDTALLRLRTIASPTNQYHTDLTRILTYAYQIEKPNLFMFLRATYFTPQDIERIGIDLSMGEKDPNQTTCLNQVIATRDLSSARALAKHGNEIVRNGVSKVKGFSWSDALALLNETLPIEETSDSYTAVLSFFKRSMKEAEALELFDIALARNAASASGLIGAHWFKTFSNQQFSTLTALVARVQDEGKDRLIEESITVLENLSFDQAKTLVSSAHLDKAKIARSTVAQLRTLTHAEALELATYLKPSELGSFFVAAIPKFPTLTVLEIEEFLSRVTDSNERETIVIRGFAKVRDPKVSEIVLLASRLTDLSKDKFVSSAVGRLNRLTIAELVQCIDATIGSAGTIATNLVAKITDLSLQSIMEIGAKIAPGYSRDTWFIDASARLTALSSADVISILKFPIGNRIGFVRRISSRISDVNPESVVEVALAFPDATRDSWTDLILPRLSNLNINQAVAIVEVTVGSRLLFARKVLGRMGVIDASKAVALASVLQGSDRDSILIDAMSRMSSLSLENALAILQAGYLRPFSLVEVCLKGVSSLTVNGAVQLIRMMDRPARDEALLRSIDLVVDLNEQTLRVLTNEAFSKQLAIWNKGQEKIKASAPKSVTAI